MLNGKYLSAVCFSDNFPLVQKYGLQLFGPKYTPYIVNHEKTKASVSYISIDFTPSFIEDIFLLIMI